MDFSRYFPELSETQRKQFDRLAAGIREWNDKINVISRKDVDNLETNHILHSLAIAKLIRFQPGTTVIDFGTGGGFPGLPLAIMFPDAKFHLVDRVGKKLKVAEAVAQDCGLNNVSFQHGDFGECKVMADFIVSRAVMPQKDLIRLSRKNLSKDCFNALPNGWISLKGGDLTSELQSVGLPGETVEIKTLFDEPFFETKKIVYSQGV